jgi:CheY-like chemotaxis protein
VPDLPQILLIEDNPDDRDLFIRALTVGGLEALVVVAKDAVQAVLRLNRLGEFALTPLPALVVLDLGLPGLHGKTLLQVIRNAYGPRAMPVVVLTGSLDAGDRAECEACGISDFIEKPTTTAGWSHLVATVRERLAGPTPAAAPVAATAPARKPDFSLMVIEDSEDDYRLLMAACRRHNVQCHSEWHRSGESALVALRCCTPARRPHLIVSDLDMVGLGGHEVLERIRNDDALRSLPVMILTGSLSPDDQTFCASADHYFVKPRTYAEWNVVTNLIKRYALRHQQGGTVAPVLSAHPGPPLVLHVEPQDDRRALFSAAFRDSALPAQLHQVSSAETARRFLREHRPPALIVLHLGTADPGERELMEDIGRASELRQVPIILLSAAGNLQAMETSQDLYIIECAITPATQRQMNEFIATFRQWMDPQRAQSLLRMH